MQGLHDIFEIWPSVADLAKKIDVAYPTVQKWKKRKRIPVDYWDSMIESAGREGKRLSYSDLARAHQPKSKAVAA